jgi:hypoxanthine phosphoribosyltransferase
VTTPVRTAISWRAIERLTDKITYDIKASGWLPDAIVGVARGGLVPAVMIAHALKVTRVATIQIASRIGYTGGPAKLVGSVPDLKGAVLIVDELIESGVTLKLLNTLLPGARTACLYVKSETLAPDYFGAGADKATWLDFPWEYN